MNRLISTQLRGLGSLGLVPDPVHTQQIRALGGQWLVIRFHCLFQLAWGCYTAYRMESVLFVRHESSAVSYKICPLHAFVETLCIVAAPLYHETWIFFHFLVPCTRWSNI